MEAGSKNQTRKHHPQPVSSLPIRQNRAEIKKARTNNWIVHIKTVLEAQVITTKIAVLPAAADQVVGGGDNNVIRNQEFGIGNWEIVISNWLMVLGSWLLVIGFWKHVYDPVHF